MPNLLAYRQHELLSWGFLVKRNGQDDHTRLYTGFKEVLDPAALKNAYSNGIKGYLLPESRDSISTLQMDFFRELYDYIKEWEWLPSQWHYKDVEFVFSTPLSWSSGAKQRFEAVVKQAGFGRASERHSCTFEVTEAEAVAFSALADSKVQYSVSRLSCLSNRRAQANQSRTEMSSWLSTWVE